VVLLMQSPTNPMNRTAFARTGPTTPAGGSGAFIHEAVVYNVNLVNWTVDVRTVFDRLEYKDIQVGSPYMHPNNGEGMYCIPDVGAKCYVCIPSDGPPPFVLSFMMPMVTIDDASTDDAPVGTAPSVGEERGNGDYTYAGGRPAGKPGDIGIRGRDGNFLILHRGGVLQIGCSALAQRVFVPLRHLVTDISHNYEHFTSGGAEHWGIQDISDEDTETVWRRTIRVFADTEFADIRITAGSVTDLVPEPAGDAGETSPNALLGIAPDNKAIFEFALCPDGFDEHSGDFTKTPATTKFRFMLDKNGGAMVRFEGSVNMRVKERARVHVDKDVDIIVGKVFRLVVGELATIVGGKRLAIGTDGGVVVINGGDAPVAYAGSMVNVVTPVAPPLTVISPTGAPLGIVQPGQLMVGAIQDGRPTVLV
jgi:hypothetical protein